MKCFFGVIHSSKQFRLIAQNAVGVKSRGLNPDLDVRYLVLKIKENLFIGRYWKINMVHRSSHDQ